MSIFGNFGRKEPENPLSKPLEFISEQELDEIFSHWMGDLISDSSWDRTLEEIRSLEEVS